MKLAENVADINSGLEVSLMRRLGRSGCGVNGVRDLRSSGTQCDRGVADRQNMRPTGRLSEDLEHTGAVMG